MVRWHIYWLVLAIMLVACDKQGESAAQILLTVDGRIVTLPQFRDRFAKTLPADQELAPEEKSELERSFLVQTVDRELTLAEAARRHIDLSDAEVDAAVADARADYPAEEFQAQLAERGLNEAQWRQDLKESRNNFV